MKIVNRVAPILILVAGLVSCKKDINCDTPVIKKVFFYSSVSQLLVPDTTADLVKFKKGSAFGLVSEVYPALRLTKVTYNKSLELPDNGAETYDYDWKITLHPSNKVYYISKITHENNTSKTHHCTSTVKYSVNDSVNTVPGNPYSSTPYFVSDIQIMYW
jgi:hypothetical protein